MIGLVYIIVNNKQGTSKIRAYFQSKGNLKKVLYILIIIVMAQFAAKLNLLELIVVSRQPFILAEYPTVCKSV